MWKLITRGARESFLFERGGGGYLKREAPTSPSESASLQVGPSRVICSWRHKKTYNKTPQEPPTTTGHGEAKRVPCCSWLGRNNNTVGSQQAPTTAAQPSASSCKGSWFNYKFLCKYFCSSDPSQNNSSSSNTNSNNDPGQRRRYKSLPNNFCDTWLGAVGYSGALIVGWVLSQHNDWRWRNWYHNVKSAVISNATACTKKQQTVTTTTSVIGTNTIRFHNGDGKEDGTKLKYSGLIQLLAKVALSQPSVPSSGNNNLGGDGASSTNDNRVVCLAYDSTDSDDQSSDGDTIEFGPVTAQQAIEEAGNELVKVHNSIVGEMENRKGVEYMSRHEHWRAAELFRRAATRVPGGYAPAAYNLAQCYELGLGTVQDYSKAAKWYRRGSDLGHASSMYNLGVFYAHGWGGLEISQSKAANLIKKAAALGQPDAIAALGGDLPTPDLADEHTDDFVKTKDEADKITCTGHNKSEEESFDDGAHLYNLAVSYENSLPDNSVDPYLILQMYQFASEKGHTEAKSKLRILKAYDAIGLLSEYLLGEKKHKSSSGYGSDISLVIDAGTSGDLNT